MTSLGVHSEIGPLGAAIVCRPGLPHQRLTAANHAGLLFDDLFDLQEAQNDHDDFVLKLQQHGVDVLELRELLSETLSEDEGRAFVLDRRITRNEVGPGLAPVLRAWLNQMPVSQLAEHLIGGLTLADFPKSERISLMAEAAGGDDFILPPLPNTLFQRDTSSWIFGGVVCNPTNRFPRASERLLLRAIYRFHPRFKSGGFRIWWGDSDEQFGAAIIDGGDVMPLGKGVVVAGTGAHTTRQAVFQIAEELFKNGAANRLICCVMPKSRGEVRLDTCFTFSDRDLCIANRELADQIHCFSAYPVGDAGAMVIRADEGHVFDVLKDALGLKSLRVVNTSGDPTESVVALAPGVVVCYDRNAYIKASLSDAGVQVITVRGEELGRGRAGCHRLVCPISRAPVD
jgi:arginine deiminase